MDILKTISTVSVADIENVVTAKNLCLCRNPVERAFEVSPTVKNSASVSDRRQVLKINSLLRKETRRNFRQVQH